MDVKKMPGHYARGLPHRPHHKLLAQALDLPSPCPYSHIPPIESVNEILAIATFVVDTCALITVSDKTVRDKVNSGNIITYYSGLMVGVEGFPLLVECLPLSCSLLAALLSLDSGLSNLRDHHNTEG